MKNADSKIKAQVLASQLEGYINILKQAISDEKDTAYILKKILFPIRKIDHIYDNRLSVLDDILLNDFAG